MYHSKISGFSVEALDHPEAQHAIKLTMVDSATVGRHAAVLFLSSQEGRALAVDLIQVVHQAEVKSSLLKQQEAERVGI